jgi:protein-disulfide isomerase
MIRITLAAFVSALTLAACSDSGPAEPYTTVEVTPFMGEAVLGDPAAPVEIIEYASTTCIHCAAFHEEVLPDLKSKYVDTGKAKLVYRVLPTPPVELSVAGAALARCAGQDKFFEVIDDLFDNQKSLAEATREPRKLQRLLVELGGRHGLSADEVGSCIASEPLTKHIVDVARAAPKSVVSTPSFIVNGKDVEGGNSLEVLSAAIDSAPGNPPNPAETPAQ